MIKKDCYRPIPYREGNRVVNKYVEELVTKLGFIAEITYVDYKDKKNRLNERFVMFVKWS
jgi:hypothetical protein